MLKALQSSPPFFSSSKREEIEVETDSGGRVDGHARLIRSPRENAASTPTSSDEREKKGNKNIKPAAIPRMGPLVHEGSIKYSHQKGSVVDVVDHRQTIVDGVAKGHEQNLRIFSVPNSVDVELVAADDTDWQWLCENIFATKSFQDRFAQNKVNISKLKVRHTAWQKSFQHLFDEMGTDNSPINQFKQTHFSRKGSWDAGVEEKYNLMLEAKEQATQQETPLNEK
ncbi:hypothetical protein H6P81_002867 [Aristolochia fimbriata]|uniref:Uncharacterized protein n=1 Tax=Aristolochia fimbriata TaxID=158543 RepID=A0AAV7FCN4_ARIFI|nr:hypothetical protein H6P81_002867 [Aristolochia fimbriata]